MTTKTPKRPHTDLLIELLQWLKAVGVAIGITLILAFIIWLIPQPYYRDGFRNLGELQEYAQTIDEWIKMDGENFFCPNYESYYQANFAPSLSRTLKEKLNWILYTLHLKRQPLFSASFFKTILENVTELRQNKGWQGDFIQKIETKENSKLVVFGATQGAFHGLVRYLEKLNELGIIDKNLKIQNPDYHLIFLGNVVNRSPYTLEIFSIVLRLLQRNPENVVYLKGTQESTDTWKQHTLRRELELRAFYLSSEEIPLRQEVDRFFNTLPITLYCTIPFIADQKLNYFKCAGFIENDRLLALIDAQRYATFLKKKSSEKLSYFNLNSGSDNDPEAENIVSRAIVRGIKKRDSYEAMEGLRLIAPTKGITTWTVLSSAAEPNQLALKFFYDAFVIIYPATDLKSWKITLYNRHVINAKDNFFNDKSFPFFFSGQQSHNNT